MGFMDWDTEKDEDFYSLLEIYKMTEYSIYTRLPVNIIFSSCARLMHID